MLPMRWRARLTVPLVAVLALGGALVTASPASAVDDASISGTIHIPAGVTFTDLRVYALRSGNFQASTLADGTTGAYTIANLPEGTYNLQFLPLSPSGYLGQWWNGAPDYASSQSFAVAAHQAVTGKDATLQKYGAISGTVYGSGVELANVKVTYQRADGASAFVNTDANGDFAFANLLPGTYTVAYDPIAATGSWSPEYWTSGGGTPYPDLAETFTIPNSGGTVTRDIDLAPGATISGVLSSTNGITPTSITTLALLPDGSVVRSKSNGGGNWSLAGLPTGVPLRFFFADFFNWSPEYLDGARDWASATPRTLTAGSNTGNIQLEAGGRVSGYLTNDDGVNLNGTKVVVYAFSPGMLPPKSTYTDYIGKQVVTGGQYNITGLSMGQNRLEFIVTTNDFPSADPNSPPASTAPYLTQFWNGAYTYASSAQVTVAAGQQLLGYDVQFERAAYFADVPPGAAFYSPIQWMFKSGISTGTPQPSGLPLYNPASAVSRQAMASFLYKLSGQTFSPPLTASFADVPTSSTFYTAIEWMKAQGISTGTAQPSGLPLFKPSDAVSRQSMAVFLARYAGVTPGTPTTQRFADVPVSSTLAWAIDWMWTTGISTGTAQPSGLPLYKPVDPVSRQAMAAFLFRVAKLP